MNRRRSHGQLRHSSHEGARTFFRLAGPALIIVGGFFLLVGVVDFFSVFNRGGGMPTKFWMCFVGMPLLAAGIFLTKIGFMGAAARYVAGEIAPVGKDTINYMARGTKEAVRDMTGAIAEGLRGEADASEVRVRCHKCNAENEGDARFCDACGTAIQKTASCSSCGELNDPDANFCDHCGTPLR